MKTDRRPTCERIHWSHARPLLYTYVYIYMERERDR